VRTLDATYVVRVRVQYEEETSQRKTDVKTNKLRAAIRRALRNTKVSGNIRPQITVQPY
jgi:hypothetical protein